ncbi:eukaryotic cytochrome b561-domain-containing protein [Triangularia verruculosa]|uniref:Eukaryotic cytochrome b561-domain-containing protein n=1 Tax=Triangularia verruculosa TaxID=2587418 RepID=A0AAN6XKQ9_9PEZI|nr:eukaryotic cytochrome b561-domain-containing protein [Triangularia verruculosa]
MASTTPSLPQLPEEIPRPNHHEPTESEPLLGRPGDALQRPNSPMYRNLYLGTGILSQAGLLLLLLSISIPLLSHRPLPPLLVPHPLLQLLGLALLIQAILILQPTTKSNPTAKSRAAKSHGILQLFSFLLFLSGTAIIETNKHVNKLAHFHSVHAYLGVITLSLLVVQYLFGFTIYVTPNVWGGEDKARQLWKWHRYVGYGVLVLLLATTGSAVWTEYIETQIGVSKIGVVLGLVLIAAGVFPRVQLGKLGLREY